MAPGGMVLVSITIENCYYIMSYSRFNFIYSVCSKQNFIKNSVLISNWKLLINDVNYLGTGYNLFAGIQPFYFGKLLETQSVISLTLYYSSSFTENVAETLSKLC